MNAPVVVPACRCRSLWPPAACRSLCCWRLVEAAGEVAAEVAGGSVVREGGHDGGRRESLVDQVTVEVAVEPVVEPVVEVMDAPAEADVVATANRLLSERAKCRCTRPPVYPFCVAIKSAHFALVTFLSRPVQHEGS